MDSLDEVRPDSPDDADKVSVSSEESIEVISDSEPEDNIHSVEESSPGSESSESLETSTFDSMTASEVEVLDRSQIDDTSLTGSGYVVTSERAKSSSSSSDDEGANEVAELIGAFLNSTNVEQTFVQNADSLVQEDGFPNLNGAGDHSNLPEPPSILEPPEDKIVQFMEGATIQEIVDEDDDDDFEDETLSERLWGLTEMFPESVRSGSRKLFDFSKASTSFLYVWGRKTLWVVASSAIVLYLPVAIEVERIQMEKESLGQAQDILLGPNAPGKSSSDAPPMPVVPL